MADIRIKDLTTEAAAAASDDFIELDGATNGGRKLRSGNIASVGSAPRGGIISTGASAVGTTQDNTGLAFGTADVTFGAWVRLPDWTPSGEKFLLRKSTGAGALGVSLTVNTDGTLKAYLGNGVGNTAYTSTAATGIADGAWAFLAWTFDRDGNLVFGVNGSQLGTAVSIAAQSAQSLTSATAILYWLSDGTTPTAGTLGETFIVNGLLTATQIADIYKAGSIAPFAASFTFYQWADFSQGYGPIIKDRSGQNQHALMGTSGLSHAVPRNPPGIPQCAPRTALVMDGSTTNFIRNTLGSQDPATGELTVWADFVFPAADGTSRRIVSLSPSTTDVNAAKAFELSVNTSTGTFLRLYGAANTDQRILALPTGFATLMAGKRCVFALERGSIFLGVDGDWLNITNLAAASTAGASAPAWTDDIDGTYLIGGSAGTSANSTAITLYDLRLANVAMTEAQLRTEYERGEPGPEWRSASKSNLSSATFSNDTAAATFTGASATGFAVAGTTGGSAGTAGRAVYGSDLGAVAVGMVYKVTFTATINSGEAPTVALAHVGNGYASNQATVTAGANSVTLTIATSRASTRLAFVSSPSTAIDYAISSVVWEKQGYTTRLRTDTAAGLTALNGAKSSTNDSTDFLLSTTGVTTSPNGRRQIIRPGTLTFTSPGTLNLQLFGASVVDTSKKWRIVSFSGTANGAANLSLGSASAGAQYVSAQAVTAADFDIGTFVSRRISGANLWLASSATVTITDPVLILEQVD